MHMATSRVLSAWRSRRVQVLRSVRHLQAYTKPQTQDKLRPNGLLWCAEPTQQAGEHIAWSATHVSECNSLRTCTPAHLQLRESSYMWVQSPS
jgi:hypothetical protein